MRRADLSNVSVAACSASCVSRWDTFVTNCSFPRESASSRCRGATPLVGTCSSRWPTLAAHSAHVGVCAAEVSAAGAATPLRTAAPQRVTRAVHPAGRGAAGAWWSSTSSSCCSQPSAPTRITAPWCSRQRLRPARLTCHWTRRLSMAHSWPARPQLARAAHLVVVERCGGIHS